MRYTNGMGSNDMTFQLDTDAAQSILTDLAMPLVEQAANAIQGRAESMASSMSTHPPSFSVSTKVGTIRRGTRAIATVTANGLDAHAAYIGYMALTKSKDAGRV